MEKTKETFGKKKERKKIGKKKKKFQTTYNFSAYITNLISK